MRLARLTALAALFFGPPGCGEKRLRPAPLPDLVRAGPAPDGSLSAQTPLLVAGERLTWEVSWRGIAVGRAQFAVAPAPVASGSRANIAVRTRFRTRGVARKINRIDHDLTTEVALVALPSAGERDPWHTIHSAFAALRSWARPDARPGFLMVRLDGRLYRLEVAEPRPDHLLDETTQRAVLRVECRAMRTTHAPESHPPTPPLLITFWFSADNSRVPLRIDVIDDGAQAHALLIERDVIPNR